MKNIAAKLLCLAPFLILSLNSACKSDGSSKSLADNSAKSQEQPSLSVGIPTIYFGVHNISTGDITFEKGHIISAYDIVKGMIQIEGTGGQSTDSPVDCSKAELWAKGASIKPTGKMCRIEYVGTGRLSTKLNGVALHVIPLDAKGSGIKSYEPKVKPLSAGKTKLVAEGPPIAPNSGIDEKTVLTAMHEVAKKFSKVSNRKIFSDTADCLKNAKASSWTDIQAHYYCLYPYTIRYCYSAVLAETRNPKTAFDYCSTSANANDWKTKREAMFHSVGPGGDDWDWLLREQKAVFIYIMFSQLGKTDFNLEQQNSIINSFYKTYQLTRPRRAEDTFEQWLPEQPRYDHIRSMQKGEKLPSNDKPTPQPSSPVKPSPVVSSQGLQSGTYVEARALESVSCEVEATDIQRNKNGYVMIIDLKGKGNCRFDNVAFRPGLKGWVRCQSTLSSCKYTVETKDATRPTYEMPAIVTDDSIEVETSNGEKLVWKLAVAKGS